MLYIQVLVTILVIIFLYTLHKTTFFLSKRGNENNTFLRVGFEPTIVAFIEALPPRQVDLFLKNPPYSVPHLPTNFGGIAGWVAELNAALCLGTRAKKWKYKFKLIFHFLEWGPTSQPVAFTVTFCAPAPLLASGLFFILQNNNLILFIKSNILYYLKKK